MVTVAIPLLLGSVRIGRRSEAVAQHLFSIMEKDPRFAVELLDLAEYNFAVLSRRPAELPVPPPGLEDFSAKLRASDGLLLVSPEYKGGIPGALKNAIDLLDAGILRRKPVGICTVSAGGFGGLQCLIQLRLTALALGAVPIPESLLVSRVDELFESRGGLRNGAKPFDPAVFLDELHFYASALKAARPVGIRAEARA
jgi:NAD(P)H-dependent FMN reductase